MKGQKGLQCPRAVVFYFVILTRQHSFTAFRENEEKETLM